MKELSERVETINNQLAEHFGKTDAGNPIFRVVWSEDQYEKRLMDTTDEGIVLLHPEVREVPKYRQWIPEKYVLERLVAIPEMNTKDLPTAKVSYEPIWIFETQKGAYLPPRFDVAKFVVDGLYAALGKKGMRKYVDEEEKNPQEVRDKRIKKMHDELFGDETQIGDALAYGEGVSLSGPKFEKVESTDPVGDKS
jgi:hypothetical protein